MTVSSVTLLNEKTSMAVRLTKTICRLALLLLCVGVVAGCAGIKAANDTTARLSKLTEESIKKWGAIKPPVSDLIHFAL